MDPQRTRLIGRQKVSEQARAWTQCAATEREQSRPRALPTPPLPLHARLRSPGRVGLQVASST
eukprot:6182901-Pleurochrysis_carterae.AAC.1